MSQEKLPLPRGPIPKIDWRYAAKLLAEGRTTVQVATILGCSRQHVWRILRRSEALRVRTAELRRRSASEAAARLQGLRELAIDTIHNAIADGDKRTSRWLIDRMNFFDAAAAEDVAQADSAGAEMLENEHILDTVPTMAEVDAAADAVEAADSNFAVAANSAEVTALRNQWDKQETVASSNALSALRSAVTKSPSFPPPGVFADD